jgi:CRISP-associated protein Cas1
MQIFVNAAGTSLRVFEGLLSIRKPGEDKDQRVPIGKIKTILISRGVKLTTDVLMAALANDIDILFCERNGNPVGRLWSGKFGSIATIRKSQLAFCNSTQATVWVRQQLVDKMEGQAALLMTLVHRDNEPIIAQAVQKIGSAVHRMQVEVADGLMLRDVAQTLRTHEAAAAKHYWKCLGQIVPPQYRFDNRSQHPANDMFNAMINYSYGILYGKVETALIRAGIDPAIGIFHRDEYNRPVMVYDVIERFRPWSDYVVCNLCKQEVMFIEFFDVKANEFRINDHGKRLVIQSFCDYFDEVIRYRNSDRSRDTHIEQFAYALASTFKEFKP